MALLPARGFSTWVGTPLDPQPEPECAHLTAIDLCTKGFRDQHEIAGIALVQAGQRAIAGAFLLDDRLQGQREVDTQARLPNRLDRHDHGSDTRLHVASPAAIKPAVLAPGFPGRTCPGVMGLGRHHVQVAVEYQMFAFRLRH